MANKSKNKGSQFERDVVRVLTDSGIKAERIRAGWSDDRGDLDTPELPIAWQCKNRQDLSRALREGVDGSQIQAENAGKAFGVAVVKRNQRPTADAYAVMSLNQFLSLIECLNTEAKQ